MDNRAVVELRNVVFGYTAGRSTIEVSSLSVDRGVTLVVGSNGSGKSTLLRLIAGVEAPRSGSITVGGRDLWSDEVEARRQLAYVPESPELTPYATLANVMQLVASLRGAPASAAVGALERVGLFDLAGRSVRELSMGQRRRAMIATALIGKPDVLILDEPLETMDVEMRGFICRWIAERRSEGATILVATHDVASFTEMTDRILRIAHGRVEE